MINRNLLFRACILLSMQSVFAQSAPNSGVTKAADNNAISISPEQLEEHRAAMKAIGGTVKKLKPEVEAKSFRDASGDALELQNDFKKLEDFWAKANAPDAVQISKDGLSATQAISIAAKAENADQLADSFKKLTGTCGSCHSAHREKLADGSFAIR